MPKTLPQLSADFSSCLRWPSNGLRRSRRQILSKKNVSQSCSLRPLGWCSAPPIAISLQNSQSALKVNFSSLQYFFHLIKFLVSFLLGCYQVTSKLHVSALNVLFLASYTALFASYLQLLRQAKRGLLVTSYCPKPNNIQQWQLFQHLKWQESFYLKITF